MRSGSELLSQADLMQRRSRHHGGEGGRLRGTMREAPLPGAPQFRRGYVRLFVDRVEVDDDEIRLRGPKAALSKAASTGTLPAPEELVPSFVREWRPRRDSNPRPQD